MTLAIIDSVIALLLVGVFFQIRKLANEPNPVFPTTDLTPVLDAIKAMRQEQARALVLIATLAEHQTLAAMPQPVALPETAEPEVRRAVKIAAAQTVAREINADPQRVKKIRAFMAANGIQSYRQAAAVIDAEAKTEK